MTFKSFVAFKSDFQSERSARVKQPDLIGINPVPMTTLTGLEKEQYRRPSSPPVGQPLVRNPRLDTTRPQDAAEARASQ